MKMLESARRQKSIIDEALPVVDRQWSDGENLASWRQKRIRRIKIKKQ